MRLPNTKNIALGIMAVTLVGVVFFSYYLTSTRGR